MRVLLCASSDIMRVETKDKEEGALGGKSKGDERG